MKKKLVSIILGICVLGLVDATSPVFGADGKTLYQTKGCTGCHGINGKAVIPNYPNIAGQKEAYLIQQMRDIKSGKRNNGNSMVMKPIMAAVSAAEIKAIAKYLTKLK